MQKYLLLFLLGCLFPLSFLANGQTPQNIRPQWLKSYQRLLNNNTAYDFVLIKENGPSLEELQKSRMNALGSYLKSSNKIEGEIDWKSSTTSTDSDFQSSSTHSLSFKTMTTVETFNCKMVDDFWERVDNEYKYYALFAVTEPGVNAPIDNFSLTTSYASDPATWGLCLIPGAAQMHKGSYLKGGIIIGGTAAIAAGAIVCNSLRDKNIVKINQSHSADVRKYYNDKANNCVTARNVCLGTLAALYIYNIVDAFVAPGARRIIVHPTATMDGQLGVGASYNF